MTDDDLNFLRQQRDEQAIRQLILNCARGSDRKDLALMRASYHDGAFDDHGPFKGDVDLFLEWAAPHHEKFLASSHILGCPNIELEGDVAFTETYCFLQQWFKPVQSDAGPLPVCHVAISCRYVDRFERRAGRWGIARRVVAYDWVKKVWSSEQIAPDPIGNHFTVGTRTRDDIIYRIRDQLPA